MSDDSKPESTSPPALTDTYPFLGKLFDMSFTRYVTPTIAKLCYGLAIFVVSILSIVGLVVFVRFVPDARWVLLYLPFAVFAWFLVILYARMLVESTMAFFSIASNLHRLATYATGSSGTD